MWLNPEIKRSKKCNECQGLPLDFESGPVPDLLTCFPGLLNVEVSELSSWHVWLPIQAVFFVLPGPFHLGAFHADQKQCEQAISRLETQVKTPSTLTAQARPSPSKAQVPQCRATLLLRLWSRVRRVRHAFDSPHGVSYISNNNQAPSTYPHCLNVQSVYVLRFDY
ncbi:uncharacterized protein BDZ83DRAFT_725819 [Colletotrichum acutatum]|uniref:Uncharacterized protein n=1 Tax=Glomerella acutata TaxID=27357 RepID=A0AAD8XPU5_GLOAC|nr:uncharacterized protein BDZ83DRAFT_725819 [Colletotrichum acutatum]KAK1731296.1 hypothetical protein BDZ83DRAFT_725819 [Colletotrichum acutatum]